MRRRPNLDGESATSDRIELRGVKAFDGVEVWGTAVLHDDVETKRRLWNGVFAFDLDEFSPGGPDGSSVSGFLTITPSRALVLERFGTGGMQRWTA